MHSLVSTNQPMILIFVENLADPSDLVTVADYRIWSDDTADHLWELSIHLDALDFPSKLSTPSARILLLDQNEPVEESPAGMEQVESNSHLHSNSEIMSEVHNMFLMPALF